MNSFGIFPIIQQYTTFEYIKKKSMSKTNTVFVRGMFVTRVLMYWNYKYNVNTHLHYIKLLAALDTKLF
jgi:hypothetical protein